jgi:hypothetical protein
LAAVLFSLLVLFACLVLLIAKRQQSPFSLELRISQLRNSATAELRYVSQRSERIVPMATANGNTYGFALGIVNPSAALSTSLLVDALGPPYWQRNPIGLARSEFTSTSVSLCRLRGMLRDVFEYQQMTAH